MRDYHFLRTYTVRVCVARGTPTESTCLVYVPLCRHTLVKRCCSLASEVCNVRNNVTNTLYHSHQTHDYVKDE